MGNIDEKLVVKMYTKWMLSAVQIAEKLEVSPWKIREILIRTKVPMRSISEAVTYVNITRFHKVPFVLKKALSINDNELKITGIMLYWGEGAKAGGAVKFANSNPDMIRVFLLFLREICGVDEGRIKMIVHMYPDQSWKFLEDFWSGVTNIEPARFYQPSMLKGKKGTYKNKSQYGTATVTYSDTMLLKTIMGWVEEYKNKFLNLPE
jgi:hypothetical protein